MGMARGRGMVMEEFAASEYSRSAGLVPWPAAVPTVVPEMCAIFPVLCSGRECWVDCRSVFQCGNVQSDVCASDGVWGFLVSAFRGTRLGRF